MFFPMSDLVSCVIAFISAVISCGVLWLTYLNLKEIKNQFEEQNRGIAVFYIDTRAGNDWADLVIKNFGNAPLFVKEIKCEPEITWKKLEKHESRHDIKTIPELTNVLLAPKQSLASEFDIYSYPDKHFNITIYYTTYKKDYTENYEIDLEYIGNSIKLPNHFDCKDLKHINDSIQALSGRFR